MGFPSPATDYQENRLSLDQHCNTGAPGVFFFRSDTYSFREGIKPGALLIVDFGGTPVDGSLVLCVLEQEFRIMRLRLHPKRCLQELDKLDNFRGHCCKVSDEAAFCLIQRPYISKTLLTRRISPRGSP
ncbi:S24 family peptidase [Klebsiella pneumoniae]|uniref:HumD family translesion DNA polymerase n=1 Tax=Klebsiella pneumoniae TaxID=573 RepID=UPI0031836676